MNDATLRDKLKASDRDQIEGILRQSGTFRDEEILVGLELVDETLAPRPDTDYQWIVGEDHGQIIGFACFGPVPMTIGTFDLYWIAVSKDARGSGIAARLDQAVEDRVREAEGRLILAETSSTDPYAAARRFYEKRGYQIVERIPDFYRESDDRLTFCKRT